MISMSLKINELVVKGSFNLLLIIKGIVKLSVFLVAGMILSMIS